MNKYLVKILTKMCKSVGAKFKDIDFNQDSWFYNYTWTTAEEIKYKKWLIRYLKWNKKALQSLTHFAHTAKVEKIADNFIWNYGWKVKNKI